MRAHRGQQTGQNARLERPRIRACRTCCALFKAARGMTNAEIGRRLPMSETTIKTYVSRILAKLDCSNRVQAALLVRDSL
jgi:DNA-binding CsgD family transcriptional regulator